MKEKPRNLYKMFFPETIAVIGASPDINKHNGAVVMRAIKNRFLSSNIFPVNPKYENIWGMKCYKSATDLPRIPDVAFIMVPARFVPQVLRECVEKEIKNVVLLTAGFKEVGERGAELEAEITQFANTYDINLLGPNCPGFISSKLHFCMAEDEIEVGKTILITQSGGMNAAMADFANQLGIGCRLLTGIGNKAQMDEIDILEALDADSKLISNTKVIALYLESLDRPKEFLKIAIKFRKKKVPIIVFKAGRSELAQKAAFSHTGAMATSETALNALLKKAGVIRVNNVQDFLMTILALDQLPPFETKDVAILSNSGGVGVMTADAFEQEGFGLTKFSAETKKNLKEILEKHGIWQTSDNPIDLIGGGTPKLFAEAARELLHSPEVETLIVSFVKPPLPDYQERVAAALGNTYWMNFAKPMIIVNLTDIDAKLRGIYQQANLPVFSTPESAATVLGLISKIKRNLDRKSSRGKKFKVDKSLASVALAKDLPKRVLQVYGLQIPKTILICNSSEFPEKCMEFTKQGIEEVVLKIESPDIIHKSEVGGIETRVRTRNASHGDFVRFVHRVQIKAPEARIDGVWMEEMIHDGHEILIGVKKEPGFGHLISFGEGGIYTEFRKDIAFGLAPLTIAEAKEMIESTRFYQILKGVRGQPPVNIKAIVSALLRISQLVTDFPQIQELDINPAKVNERGLICLDVRIK